MSINTLIDGQHLTDIADGIRVLTGSTDTYSPSEMSEAIIDAIPTETASGNPISITDAAAYPAVSCVTTLEPVQDLHGYDKPWSGGAGKNLYNKDNTDGQTNKAYLNDAGVEVSNNSWFITDYIPLKGTTFTVSNVGGTAPAICLYDSNKSFLTGVAYNTASATDLANITITSSTEASYARFSINNTQSKSIIQLEVGSTATTYEPYSNICPITGHTGVVLKHSGADTSIYETHSVTFPQAQSPVYGCEVDWVNGVLRVTKVNVDLGTLNWRVIAGVGFYADDDIGAAQTTGITMMCSCYKSVSNVVRLGDITETNAVAGNTSLNRVYITDTSYESVSDFKQAMSGVPLVYELATPIEIPLTPEVITLLKGKNNIWTDAGTSEIEYKVDLQTYLDELTTEQASQSSQSLNLSPLNLRDNSEINDISEDTGEIEEVDEPVLYNYE